jgi:hypothetical protein
VRGMKSIAIWLVPLSLALPGLGAPSARAKGAGQMGAPGGVTVAGSPYRYVALAPRSSRPLTIVERIEKGSGRVGRWWRLPGKYHVPAVAYDGSGGGLSADGSKLVISHFSRTYPPHSSRFAVIDLQRYLRVPRGVGDPQPRHAIRRLTLKGDFSFDAISPDGSTIYLIHHQRLALALAAGALIAALLLTPAGAAVRHWIGDAFTASVRDAEPALTEVPGGGQLLVQSTDGPWVVQADGSRRLIGSYEQATWSPHGLFVGATSHHTLSAVGPDGTVHWSLSAKAVLSDPRWSASGFRIAYRAGRSLRVVAANGAGGALLDPLTAPIPPVWFPPGLHLLAFIDAHGELRIVNSDTAETIGSAEALPDIVSLGWSPSGSMLLEASKRDLRIRRLTFSKLAVDQALGAARRARLPEGAAIRSASFSPRGETVAALLQLPARGGRPPRSEVVLVDAGGSPPRRLFGAPGHLSDLAWSPNGHHLLIGWPDADQWLFIPVHGRRRVRAIDGISGEFAPGEPESATFPRVDGWCCTTPSR